MSQTKLEKLTPEQEALIPVYREKWKAIAFSTERIDRQKATEAVKVLYEIMGKQEPEILFFDSFFAAWKSVCNLEIQLITELWSQVGSPVYMKRGSLRSQLESQLESKLESKLKNQLYSQLYSQLWSQLIGQTWREGVRPLWKEIATMYVEWLCLYCNLEFCISILNCACDFQRWELLQSLINNCGWFYPLENICLVSDRPIKLFFDSEQRLHAEGSPAIQFADGYSLYSYHGITLPEKYGKIHPNQWRAQWLIDEENAELRRVLMQGIGYERICQELQADELDCWQEYTLLKINSDVDVEPIYLLKMTCPSTGFTHALRVPPHTSSAREAIRAGVLGNRFRGIFSANLKVSHKNHSNLEAKAYEHHRLWSQRSC